MNQILLDYLMVAFAIVVSWKMYYTAQPPPADEASDAATPLRNEAAAAPLGRAEPALPPNLPTPLGEALKRICLACHYDGIGTFLDGAKRSYESIVDAFAAGDMEPHAYLLAADVRDTFAAAIASRKERGETIDLTFIGFRAADIIDAGIAGERAWIEMRFVAQMVSVTRDRDGKVVAGHSHRVVDIAEIWTFERDLGSAEPYWLLTGTNAGE